MMDCRPILLSSFDDKVRPLLTTEDMDYFTEARSCVSWATIDRGGSASVHMTIDGLDVSYSAIPFPK